MGQRLEKATIGDVILSLVLPGWGVLVGLMALCKGEKRRAAAMIAIGTCVILALILTRRF